MIPRVFIPQYPKHWSANGVTAVVRGSKRGVVDLTPAQDFGEITVLLPSNRELDYARVFTLLHAGLNTFSPERDYILTIGNPILIACMGVVLGEYAERARFLDWDRDNRIYNVVSLPITEGTTKCLKTATK